MLIGIIDRARLTEIAVTFESETKIKPVAKVPSPLPSFASNADLLFA